MYDKHSDDKIYCHFFTAQLLMTKLFIWLNSFIYHLIHPVEFFASSNAIKQCFSDLAPVLFVPQDTHARSLASRQPNIHSCHWFHWLKVGNGNTQGSVAVCPQRKDEKVEKEYKLANTDFTQSLKFKKKKKNQLCKCSRIHAMCVGEKQWK